MEYKRVPLGRFDKEEEITVDWAVDAKIPEGRSVGFRNQFDWEVYSQLMIPL